MSNIQITTQSPDGCGCCGDACKGRGSCRHAGENPAPMEQPERQPLTDDEIAEVRSEFSPWPASWEGSDYVDFAHAIERACAEAWGVKLANSQGAEGGAA